LTSGVDVIKLFSFYNKVRVLAPIMSFYPNLIFVSYASGQGIDHLGQRLSVEFENEGEKMKRSLGSLPSLGKLINEIIGGGYILGLS
jgi:hypothetical protein